MLRSLLLLLLLSAASAATDTFIVAACSKLKFAPGSPYESTVASLLAAATTSASYASYTNLSSPDAPQPVRALFQCRGDISGPDCARCVSRATAEVAAVCPLSCGAAVQLDACFLRYGNESFVGVEDRTVLVRRCGPLVGGGDRALDGRDEALEYLVGAGGGAYFRVGGGGGGVRGVAQCVGDLSASECQDCLTDAIGRLRTECASPSWGDMFLAKCYVRYSGGARGGDGNGSEKARDGEETEKTLAILIGLIAGVALLIVFLSFLRKACEKGGKGGK